MKEKTKSLASTGVFIISVVGIIVLVNLVSIRLFGRLDLTDDKMYSLSDASKQLMNNLEDQILAKAFFTADLPAPYNSHTRFVQDLFEEYSAYSKGKFKFEFIDPGVDEAQKNEMMILGIPPVQIQEIRNDKFEVKQAFLGIVFYYADKKEVVPLVKSTAGLEYEFTSTLRKLTSEKLKVVGFSKGHGEPQPREEMKGAVQLLEKNYKVEEFDLSDPTVGIPPEVEALVIVNPKEKFNDDSLYQIDQFLMKGRTIAFMLNMVDVDLQTFKANNIETGLNPLLKHYGIGINMDLVSDVQNQRINVQSQQGMFRVTNVINYPLIPVITDFDKESPLTRNLDAMSFPFISSLNLAADTEKMKYQVLARTTPRSWLQTGFYQVNPMQDMAPAPNTKMGPFPVLGVASGKFTSYFADKQETSGELTVDTSQALKQSPDTRMLVIGNGSFAQDQFGDRSGASIVFFADTVDWLLQDEALISIRGRGIKNKPIMELENWQRSLIKYLNVIGVPFLLVLFGLFRWSIRKARRKGFQMASK